MITNDEEKQQLIDQLIVDAKQGSVKRTKRHYLFALIPFAVGIIWLVFSFMQVSKWQQQTADLRDSIQVRQHKLLQYRDSIEAEKGKLELIKYLKDKYQIEYLKYLQPQAGGALKNDSLFPVLERSIKASNYLSEMLLNNRIDSTILIEYFRKDMDAERVWLSLKELGYANITDKVPPSAAMRNAVTDAIFFGKDVQLADVKIIALVLTRAGFQVRTIAMLPHFEGRKLQIGSIVIRPRGGSTWSALERPAITLDKIIAAKTIAEIEYK